MDWHDETARGLPAPRDDEPSTLRQDILDELADHLACAFARELTKNITPAQAVDNVKRRFGDPRAIARRLWFDAMKEKIVSQRLTVLLVAILACAALCATGFAWVALRESQALTRAMQESNAAMVEKLAAMAAQGPAPASSVSNWVPVKFQLSLDRAGNPPAVDFTIDLATDKHTLTRKSGPSGEVDFGTLPAGLYNFTVLSPWRESTMGEQLTVPPGKPFVHSLRCPAGPIPEADASIKLENFEALADRDCLIVCRLARNPSRTIDNLQYTDASPAHVDVVFDGSGRFLGFSASNLFPFGWSGQRPSQLGDTRTTPDGWRIDVSSELGGQLGPLIPLLAEADKKPNPTIRLRETAYRLTTIEVLLTSSILQPPIMSANGAFRTGPRLNWSEASKRTGQDLVQPMVWCEISPPSPGNLPASPYVLHPVHGKTTDFTISLPPILIAAVRELLEQNPEPVMAENAAEENADEQLASDFLKPIGMTFSYSNGLRGLHVNTLMANSPASKGGMVAGDSLVALDGWAINKLSDIGWVLRHTANRRPRKFGVRRRSMRFGMHRGGRSLLTLEIAIPAPAKKEPAPAAK